MNEFDIFARYYDADIGSFTDDIDFYRQLARRTGGPILEPMCGTGRVLVPLARAGFQITGVDISAPLLAQAQQKLDTYQLTDRARLVQADICHWHADQPYQLAFIALNSLMHLSTTEQQLAALSAIRWALAEDGLLVLDLFNPDPREIVRHTGEVAIDHSFTTEHGTKVQKFVAQHDDPASQISHVTFIYDEIQRDGLLRRSIVPFTMRWLYRFELEHLLARAGFQVEMVYGSYELDEYSSDSPQLITIARAN